MSLDELKSSPHPEDLLHRPIFCMEHAHEKLRYVAVKNYSAAITEEKFNTKTQHNINDYGARIEVERSLGIGAKNVIYLEG